MYEVKIKEGLVYDKHECKLIGYTDIVDINNCRLAFEHSILENYSTQVVKHMLVLMVRGIIHPVQFPYAHYATSDAAADLLFPIVWDAIRHLEFAGLQVHTIVADGTSPNRLFLYASGISRGCTGCLSTPIALARYSLLYVRNSDDTASAPPWLLSIIGFHLKKVAINLPARREVDKNKWLASQSASAKCASTGKLRSFE